MMRTPSATLRRKVVLSPALWLMVLVLMYALVGTQPATPSTTTSPLLAPPTPPTVQQAKAEPEPWQLPLSPGPIPMQLWQTFPNKTALPKVAIEVMNTFTTLNPDLKVHFHDDKKARAFIAENFDSKILAMYDHFPLGVMRADFWRYAVLYVHGGIYADVDVTCKRPIENWFDAPPEMKTACPSCTWSKCAAVIATETRNGRFMAQWAFAGVRGHPLFYTVIKKVYERYQEGIDFRIVPDETHVHHYTGPGVWTDSLADLLGITPIEYIDATQLLVDFLKYPEFQEKAKQMGLCIGTDLFFDGYNVYNKAASVHWTDKKGYPSWRTQLERLEKKVKKELEEAEDTADT